MFLFDSLILLSDKCKEWHAPFIPHFKRKDFFLSPIYFYLQYLKKIDQSIFIFCTRGGDFSLEVCGKMCILFMCGYIMLNNELA